MKPKTKIQVTVDNLRKNLPFLSQKQINYASDRFFDKLCYATKSSAFCLECGHDIPLNNISKKSVKCSFCSNKLKVIISKKRSFITEKRYFCLASVVSDFQVIRTFEFVKYCRKDTVSILKCIEVCQNWYDADEKEIIVSKLLCGYYGSFQGNLEIRKPSYNKTYNITPEIYCKTSTFLEKYKKIGFSSKIINISFKNLLQNIKNCPHVETLLKTQNYHILFNWETKDIVKYWSTLKICIRNKYKIIEPTIYKDYLDGLKYFRKDLNNAFYVCPKNLRSAHNTIMDKKQKEEITIESEQIFYREKKKFFDLCLKKDTIKVEPLKSIPDFLVEGLALKHCVFKNSYYKKSDSLILSAKIKNKPIETIEVSLTDFRIIQCYGYDNKPSQYHNEILNLVKKNIKQIKEMA